ncbi:MAG TPA: hypothetical protein VMU63_04505 [Acidimicrobiales bacterium]|nr:hypothetical protein [Acidimicrobiales bacterium]
MALVRTECPTCGTIEIQCATVTVLRRADGNPMDYEFHCPECADEVRRPLSPRHVLVLLENGAALRQLGEAGDPITSSEIVLFARMLEEPGLLERELARLLA